MDERYRTIYGAIYDVRTGTPSSGLRRLPAPLRAWARLGPADEQLGTTIRDAIESAEGALPRNRRLREDAKALLAVNFQELVLIPLRLGGRASEQGLRDSL